MWPEWKEGRLRTYHGQCHDNDRHEHAETEIYDVPLVVRFFLSDLLLLLRCEHWSWRRGRSPVRYTRCFRDTSVLRGENALDELVDLPDSILASCVIVNVC